MPVQFRLLSAATTIALAAGAFLAVPGDVSAQCTARTQTGLGTNAVALAGRCGTSLGDLRRANPGKRLDRPGLLNIPGGSTSAVPDTLNNDVAPRPSLNSSRQRPVVQPAPTFRQPGEPPMRSGGADVPGNRYAIRRGDTLSGIASATGVPLGTLLQANPGIRPNSLAVGQTIVIPQS